MTYTQVIKPKPKRKRVINESITRQARERDGVCLYGLLHKDGCEGGLDGHHMDKRGQCGDDVIENIISLCRKHHRMAEEYLIERRELQAIMTLYHHYQYPGVKAWTRQEFMEAGSGTKSGC